MMKLRINSPFIIANLVLVPLYFSFTNYMKRKESVTNLEMGEKGREIIGSSYSIPPNIVSISLSYHSAILI